MFCFRLAMHIIYLCYYHSAGDVGLLTNTFFHFPCERHRLSCFGYALLYITAEYTFVFVDIGHSLSLTLSLYLSLSLSLSLVWRGHTRLVMGMCIRYGNLTRPDWAVRRCGISSQRDIKRPVPNYSPLFTRK